MNVNYPPPRFSRSSQQPRLSNIELLRIISMFLVLLVHVLYYSLGRPEKNDYLESPVEMVLRTELEAMSLVCVNVFVLISGWFGIAFKVKSLAKFLYQWLFVAVLVIALLNVCGKHYPLGEYKLLLGSYQFYWFVYAYLLLYIFSPVLNAFVTTASRGECKMVLGAYWAFMFLFGWIQPLEYIKHGLSPLLFFGLYLSARYLHLYRPRWTQKSRKHDIVMYLFMSIVSATLMELIVCFSPSAHLVEKSYGMFMSYVNPLTVLASFYLLLAFSKMKFHSNLVNRIAASSFAVYLVQCNYGVFDPIFKVIVIWIHGQYSGLMYPLLTAMLLIGVFVVSIVIDQVRIYSYSFISRTLAKVGSCMPRTNKWCDS